MSKIAIHPERLRQFGNGKESIFCVVSNSSLLEKIKIEHENNYKDYKIISYDKGDDFSKILSELIPEPAHILVIAPDCYFRSPEPQHLGQRRKLCIMACNSTPTSVEAIEHFLKCGENTDPYEQEKISEQFFNKGEAASHLKFVDEEYNTVAIFQHLDDRIQWHEQVGQLQWGEQQLFPSGEISVLPVEIFTLNLNVKLDISGKIALKGIPVLHSGTPSFLPNDQERIFQALYTMRNHTVIASVHEGVITNIETSDPAAQPAIDMLQAMFDVDSRYRIIIEIGFGVNRHLELFSGNSAMNEVYANNINGTVHFGLGLIPHTQYHLDIICPSIKVFSDNDELIFGGM
ncbi:hypothetical protein ACE1AT_18790 [Pelatocladus sp. BLCC-F211]|uniref:hypothetical protein n=1 Tax=Pelatocladus sp. BLCC-F211 TaxID=3342752 RepID=UPI0035BB1A11